ncbi:hypothetical protein NDU88_004260 [Pleurodeles waltl]|uniref:Uncharacterized protein n=1 Tax=Pleurodeles waltl TaxID=8319 RepID=A0AAV7RJ27_PLEWA|nr:hypothetical protein NDU88_004260 [Pleurodeles waltl]
MVSELDNMAETEAADVSHVNLSMKGKLLMLKLPANTWEPVDIALYCLLPSAKYLLVLVGEHSQLPLVKRIMLIGAVKVIQMMNNIFTNMKDPPDPLRPQAIGY